MECNCEILNITQGTDISLKVTLTRGGEAFPVELSEQVAVAMVSERGERVAVDFTVGDEGRLLVTLRSDDFRTGRYGLEVVGVLNGAKWRAFGQSVVRYTFETVKGAERVAVEGDEYDVTLDVGLVSDIVPRRTSELVNDGEDGEHPFATEEAVAALDRKFGNYIPTAQKGAKNGVAELNAEGKVPTAQAQFALRGNLAAADIDSTALQSGFYRVIGQRLGSDILGGDDANGVLIQYSDGYKEQVLHVGRTAGAAAGEQVETYARRYLPTPKRWTAWSKGGGGMAEVPPTILPNPMVKTSEGVYEFTAEVGKLYDLEKWDNLADVLRVHLPTPSDPSRGWKIGFIVQDNMQSSSWTDSDIFFMYGDSKIIDVQQLFDKPTPEGWQFGPWIHSSPQMILFKWVGKQWVVESFTNDVLYPFTYSLVREDDYYIVMKCSGGWDYKVACPKYSSMSGTEADTGTAEVARTISPSVLKHAILYHTSDLVNGGAYNSTSKKIELKHGSTVVAEIDAAPFIVDGMVDDVRIENGNLVIDFNTESGKQDIAIPLTDIFDPSNYYTKTQTDGLLSGKASTADVTALQQQVAGKQDTIQDLAEIRSGAAAGATAVQPAALQPYATQAWVGEQGFLKQHQDISGKEDKMQVVAVYNPKDPSQPVTGVFCGLSKYYRISVPIETVTLMLPQNPQSGYVENIVVYLTGGTAPAVTIQSRDMNPAPIYYHDGYAIESGKSYELNILWNGAAWVVASVEIVINN